MNLRQQIVQDKTDTLAATLQLNSDQAFLRLVHSLITGQGVHSFDPNDLVDGGQDKQLDVITIFEEETQADVFIFQTKNTASFSSNGLIQLHNGLRWLFETSRKELETLSNQALRDKILEYRALQSRIGPSNIKIHVYFVTNGLASDLSDEFQQELKAIRSSFDNQTFEHFLADPLGCDELVSLSKVQERQTRRVDADVKIRYDANNPSLIKYYSHDLKGLVCSVPAQEIARLVNDNPDESIFDLNIRRFLGTRGAVNKDILNTCTSTNSSHEFWFLNNGITVVCDQFDPVTDPDNPHIKLRNMQIVNGCQTATTLALAQREGHLAPDVRVLLRAYETQDPELVGRIVLTTNNQNQISSRDLRANEPGQLDMEEGFKIHGYYYERKPRQFEGQAIEINRLFTNEAVAQWYLAVVLKNPADARGRKYKVWGELHSKIFSGGQVEPYLIAALLGRKVLAWLSGSGHTEAVDDVTRLVAKRGSFHIGRIASFLWRGDDHWRLDPPILQTQIEQLESSNDNLAATCEQAFQVLVRVIKSSTDFSFDIDRALKSSLLDQEVQRSLYRNYGDATQSL